MRGQKFNCFENTICIYRVVEKQEQNAKKKIHQTKGKSIIIVESRIFCGIDVLFPTNYHDNLLAIHELKLFDSTVVHNGKLFL